MEQQNLYLDIPQDQKEEGQKIEIPIGGPEKSSKSTENHWKQSPTRENPENRRNRGNSEHACRS
jgi:hypothetical protein